MARMNRVELFEPREIAIVHVISRVIRRCRLLGVDPISGKNYESGREQVRYNAVQRFDALPGPLTPTPSPPVQLFS